MHMRHNGVHIHPCEWPSVRASTESGEYSFWNHIYFSKSILNPPHMATLPEYVFGGREGDGVTSLLQREGGRRSDPRGSNIVILSSLLFHSRYLSYYCPWWWTEMNKWSMFFSIFAFLRCHSCQPFMCPPCGPDNISKNLKWYSPLWPPLCPPCDSGIPLTQCVFPPARPPSKIIFHYLMTPLWY